MKKEPQLKTQRDIDVHMFITGLEGVRQRIHLADVIITSPRVDEVMDGVNELLNDICYDLDQLIKKAGPLLKDGEKKAA